MIDPELDKMYKEHALAVIPTYLDETSRKAFEITKNVKTPISDILDEFRRDGEEEK